MFSFLKHRSVTLTRQSRQYVGALQLENLKGVLANTTVQEAPRNRARVGRWEANSGLIQDLDRVEVFMESDEVDIHLKVKVYTSQQATRSFE
jgi:hypothetical protein